MTIKSGRRYKITNEQTRLVLDLSGGDQKSILGWASHGGENQQWITEKQPDGQWTIRSAEHHRYLGFESTPDNGTLLVGVGNPQLWDIDVLPGSEETKFSATLRVWVRGSSFVADFPLEKPAAGADIQLWAGWGGKNQVWVFEECD